MMRLCVSVCEKKQEHLGECKSLKQKEQEAPLLSLYELSGTTWFTQESQISGLPHPISLLSFTPFCYLPLLKEFVMDFRDGLDSMECVFKSYNIFNQY